MTYNVKLEVYEGPLDLLLHLIKKEELDIYDIPIARITEQYLSYVRTMQSLDLDVAGEFLVMAATLLQIKARMLVPQPEKPPEEEPLPGDGEEEGLDPREELVQRLLEYNRFKGAADLLGRMEELQFQRFTREAARVPARDDNPLGNVSLFELLAVFREVLKSAPAEPREIPREMVTVKQKIREILWRLSRSREGVRFRSLFTDGAGYVEIVVTFLALLELIRLRRVVIFQERALGEITVAARPPEAPAPEIAGGGEKK